MHGRGEYLEKSLYVGAKRQVVGHIVHCHRNTTSSNISIGMNPIERKGLKLGNHTLELCLNTEVLIAGLLSTLGDVRFSTHIYKICDKGYTLISSLSGYQNGANDPNPQS